MLTSALVNVPANDTTPAPAPAGTVTRHRGEHADSSLTSAQIAAFIRADIKAAQKAGGLPAMKVSIRARSFSMGQSVDITITAASFPVLNPARVREVAADRFGDSDLPRHTPRADQIQKRIEAIGAEYIRSETEGVSDYHNTNCFLSVRYAYDLEESERAAILAESTTGR